MDNRCSGHKSLRHHPVVQRAKPETPFAEVVVAFPAGEARPAHRPCRFGNHTVSLGETGDPGPDANDRADAFVAKRYRISHWVSLGPMPRVHITAANTDSPSGDEDFVISEPITGFGIDQLELVRSWLSCS